MMLNILLELISMKLFKLYSPGSGDRGFKKWKILIKLEMWFPAWVACFQAPHEYTVCTPLSASSQLQRARNDFQGRWDTADGVHSFSQPWIFYTSIQKRSRVTLFSLVRGCSTFTPRFRKNTGNNCIGGERLFPSSLPVLDTQQPSPMCRDLFSPPEDNFSSNSRSHLVMHKQMQPADSSSLTGRVGRHRPIPRHPCHHCKTRRALGPQPFSIFELFLVGGCLLFWVALYLEQYGTITQKKNTVSQVSKKQIEQDA